MNQKDLIGMRFGQLLVVGQIPSTGGRVKWKCLCDCGNEVIITGSKLASGNNKSCGCLKIKKAVQRIEDYNAGKGHKESRVNNFGYRLLYCPSDPQSNVKGYMLEHRKVMADYLGRPLRGDEVVHHVNKNKLDNRIENLMVLSRSEHQRIHRLEDLETER